MKAMVLLKLSLTIPLGLVSVDYIEGVGDIILAIDASLEEWGRVLMQLVQGKSIFLDMKAGFGLMQRKNMI